MKKLTKKQMIVTGAVAILVIGGVSAGVIGHNNSVHDQQVAKTKAHDAKVKADKKAKAEQLAKEKEATQQKQVATLLASATKNPSDSAIKAVNDAIAKLTDQKEKTKDADLVKGLNNRLALIKKAQAAVKDYQAHATDANKQKVAQAAINALTDKNDASIKAQLQKLFDESNKQAQEAAKSVQTNQNASSTSDTKNNAKSTGTQSNNSSTAETGGANNQVSSNSNTNTPANSYTASAPTNSGGGNTSSNNNAGNTGSNSKANSVNNSNTSNNGGGNSVTTPTPVNHVYQGWVRDSTTGSIIFSKNCSSWNEASAAATSFMDSETAVNLSFDGHQLNYGITQLS
ncbi:hypothetical protein [Lactococcus lactis]|uniref:hypothetical protein n=1 Tax=Lactococcus lactis TaxID=1358 RepID=UPI0015C32E2D|nr:hypothetical protein [Lactococcus lactis]MCT0076693.1 hypothetical protein [Lactococcus lactis subsp. lactis]QLF89400.1 hypothetical protein HPC60_01135 [Lactococcus lactis subsp. lactis]